MPESLPGRWHDMTPGKTEKPDMPDRDFHAMASQDMARMNKAAWIAVLPLGATEQHGPHLPLETDTVIVEGVVARLKQALPRTLPVTFLKAEPVGYSPEHLDYSGTRSLAYQEAIDRWISIGEHLHSSGINKLVLLNAHGGNSPLMTIVATELRVRFDMLCVATSWTRFGRPEGLFDEKNAAIDIHGGDIETSVMLALRPDLVEMKKAKKFSSRQSSFLRTNAYLHAYGRHAFGWKMQDLNPVGVTGNAKAATAKKGEALLDHAVEGLVTLLKEVHRFDAGLFKNPL